MMELTFECCTFNNKNDNKPRYRGKPWDEIVKGLTEHRERKEKDGPLWSPTVYKGNSTRGKENVDYLTAAVGDLDDGTPFDSIKDRLAAYEYVVHSTHTHSVQHPKYRIVIPFSVRVPASEWPEIKAAIDEHIFGLHADKQTKDAGRIYYTPSCVPGAPHFAEHHEGELLDPYALPAIATPKYTPEPAGVNGHGEVKVALGKKALDFVANGAPQGEQRDRALSAARNYLSAGCSIAETTEAIWRGLKISPQDMDREPWTIEDAAAIVKDLAESDAPPLTNADNVIAPRMEMERVGLGYLCTFPALGVTAKVTKVKKAADGLKAEIDFQCSLPGVPRNVHWGSLNLASTTGRSSLAKYLAERSNNVINIDDWKGILEDVCRKVTITEREGAPFIRFDEVKPTRKASWLITNCIPRNQITTIYGEGGGGKSYFCLALALSVATGRLFVPGFKPELTGKVLYLDYETDEAEMYTRAEAICEGGEYYESMPIIYRHCEKPLPEDIEETIKLCKEEGVVFVVVDSVAMASNGLDAGGDQNESIIKLYAALRLLNATCLLIDHVSAADLEKKGPRKPYGSIYKMNLARMAFDFRSTSKTGISPLHIAVQNIKRNDGPLLPTIGLCAEFASEFGSTVLRYKAEVIENSELMENMKGPDKVKTALQRGLRTATQLAEITGENRDNISQILHRGIRDGWIVKLNDQYGLAAKKDVSNE